MNLSVQKLCGYCLGLSFVRFTFCAHEHTGREILVKYAIKENMPEGGKLCERHNKPVAAATKAILGGPTRRASKVTSATREWCLQSVRVCACSNNLMNRE